MKKAGFILFTFLLLSLSSAAQTTLSLNGCVRSGADGNTLPGASVSLENTSYATATDINGNFRFSGIPAGTYTLRISFLGYRTYLGNVPVDRPQVLDIYLEPSSILVEPVIVRATRVPVTAPATVSYMGREQIAPKNTGQDLPFIMAHIPGAVVTSDAGTGIGYTGIRIRGSDMTRINVTLNGIPYNDPESHEVYWVDVPDIASSIDNIEIQRGVGTSTNGAASFGASINIQTGKVRREAYADANLGGGSFNTFRTAVAAGTGLLNDRFSFDTRLSRIVSDGFIDRASANLNSFFVSGTFLGGRSLLKINVMSGTEKTYQAWDGVPGEVLDTNRTFNINGMYFDSAGRMLFYENEIDDYRQDHYQLHYAFTPGNDIILNAALHFTHGEGYYEQYKEDADPAEYRLIPTQPATNSSDLITQKWLSNDFYGLTWSLVKQTASLDVFAGGAWNKYSGDHFGKVIWSEKEFRQQTFDHEWYTNNGTKQDANIYGKALWKISGTFDLFADVQYRSIHYRITGVDDDTRDLTQQHEFQFWNPKAGITWKLKNAGKVYLYAGHANREPSRANFKDADPGRVPKQEGLFNLELGGELPWRMVRTGINLFLMDYTDQLVLTGEINSVGAPVMVNVPRSYRAGIELMTDVEPVSWFRWSGNMTLSRNRIRDFTAYVDNWDDGGQVKEELGETSLSFSPEWTVNSLLTLKPAKKVQVDIQTKYVDDQYIDNTASGNRKLEAYLISDLRICYGATLKGLKTLEFNIQVNNLFNEEYETNAWVYRYYSDGVAGKMDGFFPQAGTHVSAGLRLGF